MRYIYSNKTHRVGPTIHFAPDSRQTVANICLQISSERNQYRIKQTGVF